MKTSKLLSFILTICIVSMSFISTLMVSAQTIKGDFNQNVQAASSKVKDVVQMEKDRNFELDEDEFIELIIKNKKDFSKFMTTPKYWKGYYKIKVARNIDMKNETFNSIENFDGKFEGCGHTIKNISFKCFVENNHGTISGINFKGGKLVNDSVCGFVSNNENDGVIENCMVDMNSKNVNIKAGFVCANKGKIINSKTKLSVKSEDDRVGGFVSENSGIIEKCTAKGSVNGHDSVGGFVGYNNDGTITNCIAKGKVGGNLNIGGFVGVNNATIVNCNATGNVSGDKYVGGFSGNNNGTNDATIINCIATGNVSGDEYVGGFVGDNYCTMEKCTAKGKVSGNEYVGGFSSNNYGTIEMCTSKGKVNGDRFVGGFIGENYGKIEKCTAKGSVNGVIDIGGFVGDNYGVIEECAIKGKVVIGKIIIGKVNVIGKSFVGGFAGCNYEGYNGKITKCNAEVNVSGDKYIGGFVGQNCTTVEECTARVKVNGKKINLDKFVGENEKGKIKDCEIA